MTHRFPVSRLAEIDEAVPVEPVSFPGSGKIGVLRRTLKRLRGLLGNRDRDAEPSAKTRPTPRKA